ncbi:MAG: hypothetical protein INR62_02560 [Rhodospirillales bacterium]|nr:hypothetical protein [Acetobacter sp.]
MKTTLRTLLIVTAALGSISLLGACSSTNGTDGGQHVRYSSGTPVNPDTDPGGQGVAGSRATGANAREGNGIR